MEGRALRARVCEEFPRRRGAPHPVPVMAMVWRTALRLNHRESDGVSIAGVALPFASAFVAVRQ